MSDMDDGMPDLEGPGTDLDVQVVEAEIIDDGPPDWGTPDADVIEAEITGDTGAQLEPWAVNVYAGYGQVEQPALTPTEHGTRPGGGSHGGMKGDGAGGGAGTGKTKSRNPFRRNNRGGGGGGRGDFVLFKREVHKTVNASLIDTRGAAVLKTAPINSGNTAGWNVSGGGKRTRGGAGAGIASKAKRRKW